MAEIGTAYVKIEPTAKGISAKINEEMGAAGEAGGKSFGAKFGSALGTAGKLAAGAVAAGTAAVGGFAAASVSAGASFDVAMSQVAATMGTTVDQIGDLREFAQQMGSSTSFSASQAAEALNYMALAGYDATRSMDMLPTVLDLAAAGGINLASASDMVTDAQSALGLTAEETKTMVNQMAAASSNSNTSVQQLGEAFLTIGATAKTVKGGTQELSTVLGVLADNGIKGSEGGTHLRNMLLSLQNPTDKGAAALKQLGVEVYDSEGNMRSMINIIGDMQKGMDGMDQASKDAMINGIFNKTDLASVNALLSTSTTEFNNLSTAIRDSEGAANAMANTQLSNLSGDVTLFKSALEGAQIAISDQLTPTLRNLVSFGTEGLQQLTEAFKTDGLEGAMDTLGQILSDGLAQVVQKLPEFVNAGMQLLGSLGQGILDNLPMIIDTVGQITLTVLEALLQSLPQIVEAGVQIITQLLNGMAQALPTLMPTIVDCILQIIDVLIANAPMLFEASMALIKALAEGLITALPELIEKIPEIVEAMVNNFVEHIDDVLIFAVELMVQLAAALIENLPTLIAAIPRIVTAMKNAFMGAVGQFIEVGANIISGIKKGVEDAWDDFKDWFGEKLGGLVEGVKEMFKIESPSKVFANEVGRWIPAGIAEGIQDGMGVLDDQIKAMTDDTLSGTITASAETINSMNYTPGREYGADEGRVVIHNNITVNGAEDPEEWTRTFIRTLKREARMA